MRKAILSYVSQQYGTEPEYLWAKTPDCAVIRHRGNRKWYGIIMNVPRKTLGLPGEGIIDIINVKCSPAVREILLGEGRALPAYHMNKQHWISLPLDGSLVLETIFSLIDESYELTK
jgi:predicted DNA-binding protein (MmcQ/YjbR family)